LPVETRPVLAFTLALGTALAATPVAIVAATRSGFFDRPLGYKAHRAPTPYLGGAAVLGGLLLGLVPIGGDVATVGPIVGCALVLWALGTVDDRRSLSASSRLAVEAGAATLLWSLDLGWALSGSELANLVITNVWVVGLVNAFNLMDNMDGAAATVGAVTALATAVLALRVGDPGVAVLCAGLCGACIGFLPYNLASPARIFLGDGGSLPIGFVVSASSMALFHDGDSGWIVLLAALILAGLPVVDTGLVMISRRRAGVPLLSGATDHMTHRLASRLPSPRRVALTLGLVQAALAAVAIGAVELGKGSIITAWFIWFVAAAATVLLLETRTWAPRRAAPRQTLDAGQTREDDGGRPGGEPTRRRPPPSRRRPRRLAPRVPARVTLVEGAVVLFITLALGLSPVLYGFYDVSVWGPIALFLLAALLGMVLARPAIPRPAALVALAGLVGVWLWSFLSTAWAESADQALTEANRWMLYAALFAILLLLLRNDGLGKLMLGATTAAILGFAGYLVVRLVLGDGPSLFLGGRLHEPFGYVNGQAGYLMLGFWPLIATAERASRRWVSTAAISGATLLGGLIVLTQTRSMIPALLITGAVLLALVPGRRDRVWALLFVLGGVAAVSIPLIDVYDAARDGTLEAGVVRRAALLLLLASVLAGAAWWAAESAADRMAASMGLSRLRAVSARGLAVLGVLALVVVLPALGSSVDKVKSEAGAFTELERRERSQGARLTSGAGNRYDYWRIAALEFRDAPVRGVGAGNYDRDYFRERRTEEDIRQPHSLVLQTLAELGLIGGAFIGLFIAGVLAGFRRRLVRSHASAGDRIVAVAAGGVFLTWLVHTSVDWLHLIPGVTGVALCAGAVLVAPWLRVAERGEGRTRQVVVGACAVVVVLGAVLVGRSALAEKYRSDAQDAVASEPRRALEKANDSLRLDDEPLATYYVKAAAYARLDRYAEARATLRAASRREPHDFVPWGLLGDLAVRRGDLRQARRDYRWAARLNPRDPALTRLAADPSAR
jgi:UDP-N-acetylmuramyl pentapeptide phosphotransferase/UDP-N-acetylglucosamine-1-phosphate transferase